MKNKIKYKLLFLVLISVFSCESESEEDLNQSDLDQTTNSIPYDETSSIIENTLSIDWTDTYFNGPTYNNQSLSFNSGDSNEVLLQRDTDENGVLRDRYVSFIKKNDLGNSVFKLTIGKPFGNEFLNVGEVYDLSQSSNRQDIVLTIYDDNNNTETIMSANYYKNIATNINGLGTFEVLSVNYSDDANDANDSVGIQFNNVYLYDQGKQLKFSGKFEAYVH